MSEGDWVSLGSSECQLEHFRYILEARKKALLKKKKLRSLGKRAQSADSEDEMEVDGEMDDESDDDSMNDKMDVVEMDVERKLSGRLK